MKKRIVIVEIWTDNNTRFRANLRESIEGAIQQVIGWESDGTAPVVVAYTIPSGAQVTIMEGDE